jgi:hypothetical protein
MEHVCGKCLYFNIILEYEMLKFQNLGECRRFPPMLKYDKQIKIEVEVYPTGNLFPIVDAACWCGEYKEKLID